MGDGAAKIVVISFVAKLIAYVLPIPFFSFLYARITGSSRRICQFVYSAFAIMLVDAALVGFDYVSAAIVMALMATVWLLLFRRRASELFVTGAEGRLRYYDLIAFGLVIFAILVNLAPQLVETDQTGAFNYMTFDLAVIGVMLFLIMLFIYENMMSNIEQYNRLLESKAQLEQANRKTMDLQEQMILILADIVGEKSGESGSHLKRVADCAGIIGEEMGLPADQVQRLHFAAMLHDVGKLKIPDEILHKPGKLTDEEFEEMKLHTRFGSELLGNAEGDIIGRARTVALQHHERWDGTGYLEVHPGANRTSTVASPPSRTCSTLSSTSAAINRPGACRTPTTRWSVRADVSSIRRWSPPSSVRGRRLRRCMPGMPAEKTRPSGPRAPTSQMLDDILGGRWGVE